LSEDDRATAAVSHTENFVKFGCVVFICERTDIQSLASQYFAQLPDS